MTANLTFTCNGDCVPASTRETFSANEVTPIQVGGTIQSTKHLCNSECFPKFMDGRLTGADVFLTDDDDEDDGS